MSLRIICAESGAFLVLVCVMAGTTFAINIETVPVGDPGNLGELSGAGAGAFGPDRICGSVGYTYNIGKYEVTAGQYAEFLNKVGGVDTYGLYNAYMASTTYGSGITRSGAGTAGNPWTYAVASDFVNRPVNLVSYWDSCRFTNWLHNGQPTGGQGAGTTETGAYTLSGYTGTDGRTIQRNSDWKWAVTSEDEWYKAAYYKGGSTQAGYWGYATSSNSAPGQDMTDASGNNANNSAAPWTWPIDGDKYTTVVGEFQNSDSPYGTFDQGGNVWEWNESVYPSSYRGVRGGSYGNGSYHLHASARSDCYYPSVENFSVIGFRVVQLPEPTTIVMLALAGMTLRRRR